jgi:anti-anti-sigma factor
MPLLGREAGTQVFRDLEEHPDDEMFRGITVLRLDGGLFFATSEALEDRIRALAEREGGRHARALVLDLEGVDFVDSQGAAKLAEIHQLTEADGITLRLARIKPNVRGVLQLDGLIDLIGAEHVHGNVHRAIEAELAQTRAAEAVGEPRDARDQPAQPA